MGTRAARGAIALAAVLLTAGSAAAQAVETIRPGMTEDQVKAVFGQPATTRNYGDYTYFFYQNGVEREYGTADIVFFLDGQVVDAILRSSTREYAGESSSPRGTQPHATPGGTRLQLPGEVQSVEVRATPPPPPQDTAMAEEPTAEAPAAAAPTAAAPMAQPPAAQEPAAQPPAAQEPAAQEPAAQEPAAQEAPPEEPAAAPSAEEAQMPLESLAQEFQDFVPVCIQTFVDNEIFQIHEARPLCECTARQSSALGVQPATIARITQALKTDPSALSRDTQVQQAGAACVERVMEQSSAQGGGDSGSGG